MTNRTTSNCDGRKNVPDKQRQWLERIKEHLVKNLTIEQVHFDVIPILSRAGGWGNANKIFSSDLGALLMRLNEAVAV